MQKTVDFSQDNQVLAHIWNNLDHTGAPLLWSWRQEAVKTKPYEGLKVYHNIPLSIETICKVEALQAAGAKVVVSCTDFLVPATFAEARNLLDVLKIEYREQKYAEPREFDFYLDCCAELANLPAPNFGIVEITRTGALVYQNKNSTTPILSVDDSLIKTIETFYGTGEAFIRVHQKYIKEKLEGSSIAIIGYGKVGQGIAYWARKNNAKCKIFDIDAQSIKKATSQGFEAYLCNQDSAIDAILSTEIIVTATGRKESLKHTFANAEKLFAGKILCNMGADDEIGKGFDDSTVLDEGRCVNFSLHHPTMMCYLDPTFYAHNLGIEIVKDLIDKPGFHPLPKEIDLAIIKRWSQIHNLPWNNLTELS